MNITIEDLEELGFEKVEVSEEEAGGKPFFYYSLDLIKEPLSDYSGICLVSSASDEIIDGFWCVEVFDLMNVKIYEKEILIDLINVCKRIEDNM